MTATPAPAELVEKWRNEQIEVPPAPHGSPAKSYNCALRACADELAASLAAHGRVEVTHRPNVYGRIAEIQCAAAEKAP
jgi:hypothetical protein